VISQKSARCDTFLFFANAKCDPKSTKSRNSNSSVQTQIKSKSQFEFVPRDNEESEFLDLVDFKAAAFSLETVILNESEKS